MICKDASEKMRFKQKRICVNEGLKAERFEEKDLLSYKK